MKKIFALISSVALSALCIAPVNAATDAGTPQHDRKHDRAKQERKAAPSGQGATQDVTLKDVQKQVAAIRKNKGQMRSTTNDDRWAAATRHSSRHAAAVAKGEGRGK